MSDSDDQKRRAAERGAELIEEGMIVGLGSGSTAALLVGRRGERVRGGLRVQAVATSSATQRLAEQVGIPMVTLEVAPRLDLTLDGADEIDPQLRLIKGAGGALLHEKVVASASSRLIVIADESKRVPRLGRGRLPIEVIAFAAPVVRRTLEKLAGEPALRRGADGAPYLTDEKNLIFDCLTGPIGDPERLAAVLQAIPGVVGHGLFLALAERAIIGVAGGVVELERPRC